MTSSHLSFAVILCSLAGALVLTGVWALVTGSAAISWQDALGALAGGGEGYSDVVVWQVRLPRIIAAIAAGAALAVAGAIMQAVTGNPLAEPGLLGVNAGAAFLVVLMISLGGVSAGGALQWGAFAGAAGAAVLVFLLAAGGRRGPTPIRLVLAGVIVATFLGAMTAAVLILDAQTFDTVRFWTAGSVKGRELGQIVQVLPWLAVALVAAMLLGRQFTTLSLGGSRRGRWGRTRCCGAGSRRRVLLGCRGVRCRLRDRSGLSGLWCRIWCA
ncbi:iron ABC transporter permease [Rhodobacteraceae bacterium D3-12]|nr:iron ABC transporter permease [Rhodobacteraceae bacterium D3-12]